MWPRSAYLVLSTCFARSSLMVLSGWLARSLSLVLSFDLARSKFTGSHTSCGSRSVAVVLSEVMARSP